MNKKIEEDEFEWDRTRLIAGLLILIVVVGLGWTMVRLYQPATLVNSVSYNLETINDDVRFNEFYADFWTPRNFTGGTLVKVSLMLEEVPDVSRLFISISTTLPMHLESIVLEHEGSVIHGKNAINENQTNYALTINAARMNLILYLFFDVVGTGSYTLLVRAYI